MNLNPKRIFLTTVIVALGLILGSAALAQDAAKTSAATPKAADKDCCGGDTEKAAKTTATAEKPKEEPKKAAAPQKPLPADPEERFKVLFTKAFLSGRWAPLKDGELGEEKGGDKYNIVGVTKGTNDNWTVSAKMKYMGQEFVIPIPVQVKVAGDTLILVVDKLSIPGGGTYSARLLLYERTYSGTWTGGRGGGMLYGTITNE